MEYSGLLGYLLGYLMGYFMEISWDIPSGYDIHSLRSEKSPCY